MFEDSLHPNLHLIYAMFTDSLSKKKKQSSIRVRDKSVSGGGDCEDTGEWARVGNGSKEGGVGEEEVEAFHVTHSG